MPVDHRGIRADAVLGSETTIGRMNLGRMFEHYFNDTVCGAGREVLRIMGIEQSDRSPQTVERRIQHLLDTNPMTLTMAYDHLIGLYEIFAKEQQAYYINLSDDEKLEHLRYVCEKFVQVYYQLDTDLEIVEAVEAIEASKYRQARGPVTYVGNSGKKSVTEYPVRIAPMYMMLLEKIGDDWSSVSSGKLHHFGILTPMTKGDKYSNAWRCSPVRTIGETEGRLFAGYGGRECISEMIDRSNNPVTHKEIVKNILYSDTPGNIDFAVDRKIVPLGGAKTIQLIQHLSMCEGFKYIYVPEQSK